VLGVSLLWEALQIRSNQKRRAGEKLTMSEQRNNPFDIMLEQIRLIVREEIMAAFQNGAPTSGQPDTLLTVEMAASIIGVNPRWLYRHADKLPFVRRINRKTVRFSEAGLRRWVAAKKPGSR
jgi:hypothetical protein